MKNLSQICYLILTFVLFAACKEHQSSAPIQDNSKQIAKNFIINIFTANTDTIQAQNAPNNITRTIIQDKEGDIWFATFTGVIKYDGDVFTNMTKEVSQARFFAAFEDSKGNLWFGSIGAGVFKYDGKSFQNLTTKDGLVNNQVTNIYEDSKGNLWFGTTEGISCYNGKKFQTYTTENGLPENDVNVIIEDETGLLWLGSRGKAFTFDGKAFKIITNELQKPFYNVRHIMKDKKGSMWIGGNDGLWQYDGNIFTQITKDFTGYIYEDTKGNIWTSSTGSEPLWSLSYYNTKSLASEQYDSSTKLKTGEGMFFGILEDTQGNIWSGTLNGTYRYNGNKIDYFQN